MGSVTTVQAYIHHPRAHQLIGNYRIFILHVILFETFMLLVKIAKGLPSQMKANNYIDNDCNIYWCN